MGADANQEATEEEKRYYLNDWDKKSWGDKQDKWRSLIFSRSRKGFGHGLRLVAGLALATALASARRSQLAGGPLQRLPAVNRAVSADLNHNRL